MLLQILAHTPTWVFAVFALLLWLGGRQLRANRIGLPRSAVMPVAMTGLSLYGVLSVFSHQPVAALAWGAAALVAGFVVAQRTAPAGTRYDAATRSFHLPGSAVPLALMMGIFFTKYAVGVQVALHPALANDAAFALGVSALYGAFSGMFAGRALRLWALARRDERAPAAASGQVA